MVMLHFGYTVGTKICSGRRMCRIKKDDMFGSVASMLIICKTHFYGSDIVTINRNVNT